MNAQPHTNTKSKTYLAPAKLNLYLHITQRRDDGYHDLDSLFVFAHDMGDIITLDPRDQGFDLKITGRFASDLKGMDLSDNLITRAAKGLSDLVQRPLNCRMKLQKDLPIAAGLGGGSTDAAACVRALLDHWDLKASDVQGFDAFLLSLGADVPPCFDGRPLRAQGVGELITTANLPSQTLYAALINPLVPCPTAPIFKALNVQICHKAANWREDQAFTSQGAFLQFLKGQHNDLEEPARALLPQIDDVLKALKAQEGCQLSRMSGSGASCFGLFTDYALAQIAVKAIQQKYPKWWSVCTHIL